MDAQQIAGLGPRLTDFLSEFADCFGRREPREHLRTYVGGQLSDLPRKSVEPIALDAGTPPRTLQRFLESIPWGEQRMRDKLQRIVARDHAPPCDACENSASNLLHSPPVCRANHDYVAL